MGNYLRIVTATGYSLTAELDVTRMRPVGVFLDALPKEAEQFEKYLY